MGQFQKLEKNEKFEVPEVFHKAIDNPFDPIKYDAIDWQSLLSQLARSVTAIEQHLETGAAQGKAFIRASQRPAVDAAALAAVDQVRLLSERVQELEKRLEAQG